MEFRVHCVHGDDVFEARRRQLLGDFTHKLQGFRLERRQPRLSALFLTVIVPGIAAPRYAIAAVRYVLVAAKPVFQRANLRCGNEACVGYCFADLLG